MPALNFVNGTDLVDVGNAAGLNSINTGTVCGWVYPTTASGIHAFYGKGSGGANTRHVFWLNVGVPEFFIDTTLTSLVVTSGDPILPINRWYFLAVTFALAGSTGSQRMFVGTEMQPAREISTYGAQTPGTGTSDDSATTLRLGNNVGNAQPWLGAVSAVGVWTRLQTLDEIRFHQRAMLLQEPPSAQSPALAGLWQLGWNWDNVGGLTQRDLSGNGNNGAINGTTQTAGPALPAVLPWIRERRRLFGATPLIDQNSFRWRDDDGSEAAATWLATQGSDITRAKLTNTRLRMLLNATNDPAAKAFKLQYRKSGGNAWRDIVP